MNQNFHNEKNVYCVPNKKTWAWRKNVFIACGWHKSNESHLHWRLEGINKSLLFDSIETFFAVVVYVGALTWELVSLRIPWRWLFDDNAYTYVMYTSESGRWMLFGWKCIYGTADVEDKLSTYIFLQCSQNK